jgi:hypothetical protein
MNARTAPVAPAAPARAALSPRFDATFIEEHKLIERYLENKLPAKGARDLELWCRAHPEYLAGLKLPERTQASLKLLEASGQPQDLGEPAAPWWKSPIIPIAAAAVACASLLAFWVLVGKYHLLRGELEEAKERLTRGSLVQPATSSEQYISPDRAPGMDHSRITVTTTNPQLVDLHVDMAYAGKKMLQYRVTVDKEGQGRALILNNVLRDSNNEIRMTFNTTGIATGLYRVRIEALPMGGQAVEVGWFLLDVK